jgi:hypothetical protein
MQVAHPGSRYAAEPFVVGGISRAHLPDIDDRCAHAARYLSAPAEGG